MSKPGTSVRALHRTTVAEVGQIGQIVRPLGINGLALVEFSGQHALVKLGRDVELVEETASDRENR